MSIRPTTDNRQPTTGKLIRIFILLLVVSYLSLVSSAHAQSVDILWQGEVYTPPFYQGKTFWSKQSRVTLVAIPQGLGNTANLNYKWTKNGTVLGNINGIGRNYLSFVDSILSRPQTIEVAIVSGSGNVLAKTSTLIVPITPALAVYESNPLYGFMFHKEVGEIYDIQGQEVTFAMFPLFVSALGRVDNVLNYRWETNGKTTGSANSATYRIPENVSGSSKIVVNFSNTKEITQRANKSFLVQFENQ